MESWSVGFDGDSDVERHAGAGESQVVNRPDIRIRTVSDYIWPWCFIGLVRVERLQQEVELELDFVAYDLKPGLPLEGLPRKEASAGKTYPPGYIDSLIQTANDAGIDMKRPPLIPNTRKAHEATEFARESGCLQTFHRAVFHAYFEEEQNIGDVDVLCEIGAASGLDAEGLRAALDDGRYASVVEEQMQWGRAVGVTGVPTFIFNEKFALVGAQDYNVFSDLASRIARGALKSEDSG